MKRTTTWMLPIVLLLFVGTSGYSVEPASGQEASKDAATKPDAQITKWILQLDSDEFKVREQAAHALIKTGLKALPTVLKATQSKQPEARDRAFAILFEMSKSDDKPTANAVRAAAKEILKSQDRLRVAQAKKILEYPNIHARQILLELGARFPEPDYLDFSLTPVTDEHMVHLKRLKRFQKLSLYGTKVTDAGLMHLKGLKSLQGLYLNRTKVTDAGLEHLKGLKSLQGLTLGSTKVTNAGLEHLKGLVELKVLSLNNTKVTDAGLENLKGMHKLQHLDLNGTNVTDAGLEHLKGLTELKGLFLILTNVTDEGVKKLQQTLPNCKIQR